MGNFHGKEADAVGYAGLTVLVIYPTLSLVGVFIFTNPSWLKGK